MTTTEETDQELSRFTPAMRQFVSLKRKYPNQLVLYRIGDFFETFLDDARKANRLLGLTLTHRGKTKDGEDIAMAGIPMATLDQYVARLVRMGESVVIVDQFGLLGKGTMERKVTRIVTPGTLTDAALLPEKEDAVLLAAAPVAEKKRKKSPAANPMALVWLTLSNGDFRAEEVTEAEFASAAARIAPREVLVPDAWRDRAREILPEATVTPVPDWHFDAEHGKKALCQAFGLETLEAWGMEDRKLILEAANALIDYVEETQVEMVPFLEPLKLVETSDYVVIDPASRRNLEISDSIRRDAGDVTLFSVLDHCETSMGSRELRRWLNQPLRSPEAARSRHDAVERLLSDDSLRESVCAHLKNLPDIERISSRVSLGSVRPRELAGLRDALPQVSELSALLKGTGTAELESIAENLLLDPELHARLANDLLDEPAALLREGDVMSSGCCAELAELRKLRDHTGEFLLDLEKREREATGLSTLRVEYNRVHGFFIEVSKAQSKSVPAAYIRRQTLKNTERYITPELKTYEEKALSAKERSAQLERALYQALIDALRPHVEALMHAARSLAALDVLGAFARHAAEWGWTRPKLAEARGIRITEGRHPVVETTIEQFVPNDCVLNDRRRMLIITGPNMGGKSTFMRAAALIVLLAWAGSFVPAKSASIGPVDRILTRIGASDDLSRGRSTFMVEMTEAAAILHGATETSLVLMDEVGRGTSTYDGLSLAGAIAQTLAEEIRAMTLFATHYFELTSFALELEGAVNVHVSAAQSRSKIVFLHKIEEGPANRSYGIAVAQLAGVPAPVVRRAKEILSDLEAGRMPGMQPSLFFEPPPERPDEILPDQAQPATSGVTRGELQRTIDFLKAAAQIDADGVSPLQALGLLYQLKKDAGAELEALEEVLKADATR